MVPIQLNNGYFLGASKQKKKTFLDFTNCLVNVKLRHSKFSIIASLGNFFHCSTAGCHWDILVSHPALSLQDGKTPKHS